MVDVVEFIIICILGIMDVFVLSLFMLFIIKMIHDCRG